MDRPSGKKLPIRPLVIGVFAALAAVLVLLSLIIAPFWDDLPRMGTYSATYVENTFDTTLTVTVGAASSAEATEICTDIHTLVSTLHKRFDAYGEGELARLNASAGSGEDIALSEDLAALLTLGMSLYDATGGKVNICLGPVTSLWHDARTAGDRLPEPEAIREALTYTDPSVLTLNGQTATLAAGARLDVGAIAKGYAMQVILDYARKEGIESLLVNLGGHLLAVGNHPDGAPWRVSIPNPVTGRYETLELSDVTVSTSGDYERTYTVDGKAYHHLIDPATGYPADIRRSATVILPLDRVAEADGYATALFLMEEADGEALLASVPGARAIRIATDGSVSRSDS